MKNKTIDYIIEFVDSQGTVVQEEGFEQVPVHHLTKKNYAVRCDVVLYIGKYAVFCESKNRYLYTELDSSELKEILNIIS